MAHEVACATLGGTIELDGLRHRLNAICNKSFHPDGLVGVLLGRCAAMVRGAYYVAAALETFFVVAKSTMLNYYVVKKSSATCALTHSGLIVIHSQAERPRSNAKSVADVYAGSTHSAKNRDKRARRV